MSKSTRLLVLLPAGLLLCLGGLSFLNRAATLHGEDGVTWAESGQGLEAARVEEGSAADLAGLQRGDRLLRVEGVAPTRARGVRDLLWGREGRPTTYRIQRREESLDLSVVPRPSGEENRLYYYLCVVAVLALGAGCLALINLPADPAAPTLYGLCLALFAVLALSPGGSAGALDWVFYWGDLAGRLLLPPLLIQFILRLESDPETSRSPRGRGMWLYLPAAALGSLALYLIPLRGALTFTDPAFAIRWKDRLELFYLTGFAIAAVILLCLKLWICTRARARWRLRWVAAAAVAGLLPPAILYLLPLALGIPVGRAGEIAVLPLAAAPLGFTASLFQERSVDLARSLRAAVRWLTAGSVFLAAGLACSWLLAYLSGGSASSGVLAEVVLPLAVASVLSILLYRPLSRITDDILARKATDVSRLLFEFRNDLNGEILLGPLASRLVGRLEAALDVRPVLLLVEGSRPRTFRPAHPALCGPEWSLDLSETEVEGLSRRELVLMESAEAVFPERARESLRLAGYGYLFPMVIQGELRAILLVGRHRDASALEGRELDALAGLAAQAARSVEAARLYREIQERISREERLRRETQAILEYSRIGILLVDASGRVTSANRSAVEILGHPALLGKQLHDLLPRGLLMLLDRSGKEGRGEREGERVFRFSFGAADGANRVVNATRAFLGGDPSAGRVYTLDDITEVVGREEKMARQDHLAAMGMLASEVAHEVNTPLTGIASYTQMLMVRLKSRLPEMELLRKIESQAFRAAGITGSVLSFARAKEQEPPQLFDAGPAIAESLALFESHLKGKRIRLSTERAPSLPPIRGHRGKIQQVILNLLMNAAQALPSGGEIRLALDRDGESVRIRVSDNGVGIPSGILPRIFEPFFTARPNGKGTGLGLSVVRQIVGEHGGRIHVESVEGAGTTFTVALPVALCPRDAEEVADGA